jgi:hypothetical protein
VFILLTTVSRSEQVEPSSQPNILTYLRSILVLSLQFAIYIADGRQGTQTSVLSHVSELSIANIPLLPDSCPCRVATISCSGQSQGYVRPTVCRPVCVLVRHPPGIHEQIFIAALSNEGDRSVVYTAAAAAWPAQ